MKNYFTTTIVFVFIVAALFLNIFSIHASAKKDSLKTITLPEVVATGNRTLTDTRLLPMTINIIKQDKLEELHSPNILPTIMEQVPGLFVTQRSIMGFGVSTGGSGGIKIRGIGSSPNTGILVLIDGLPQYAGLYGHPISDNYQTMMAERVEIIRGPASLFYGSNAMGGVMNIVTRKPKSDTIITNLHIQGGSFYTIDAGINNQIRKGKFSSSIGFNYSKTDGHRKNMEFDEYNAFIRLGYDISSHWKIDAMGNVAYFNSSNPGTIAALIEDNDMHILRGMASLSFSNEYNKTSGAMRVFYNGGHHKIDEGYAVVGGTSTLQYYHHTDILTGISIYQMASFFKGNKTTIGLDYQHLGGHAWNESKKEKNDSDIIHKSQYDIAAYIDLHQQILPWLSLEAGIRFDGYSEASINYIPQGGLSFLLPRNTELKLLISRGFRNATIRELYMYRPANSELNAESLWNYELSYRQYLIKNRLKMGANIYYLHAKDLISTQMIEGRPLNINTGEMKNYGVELELAWQIIKRLNLNANYSYLHMKYPTIAAPQHKLNLAINYHHKTFRIGTNLQYIGGLFLSVGDNEQQENYMLWNAHFDYRIYKNLWVYIKTDNLLGKEYEINLGFPMPRTTIIGGISWTF